MRLFPLSNPLGPDELREQRESEAIWNLVRGEDKPAAIPNLSEITMISGAVRESMGQRDLTNAADAAASFNATHERLMQAISASRPIVDIGSSPELSGNSGGAAPASSFASLPAKPAKSPWRGLIQAMSPRNGLLRYAAAPVMLVGAYFLGHHQGQTESPYLPVAMMVADYDKQLRVSANSFDFKGADAKAIAAELSPEVGMQVRLPEGDKFGARLLGVRKMEYDGVPTVEAHFEQDGTRVAFVQAKAPQRSLRFVTEANFKGRTYMIREVGVYRVIAWREDDSVLAVLSPLGEGASLKVAQRIRDSVPNESTA